MLKWFKKTKKQESHEKYLKIIFEENDLIFSDNLSDEDIIEFYLGIYSGVYLKAFYHYIENGKPECFVKLNESIKKLNQAMSFMQSTVDNEPLIPTIMSENK